jgi:hypothetical protein
MTHQPKSYKKFIATAATATLVATAVVPAAFADEATTAAFTDVPTSYADAVSFLIDNSFAIGLSETQFGISAQITRGDAAIIIASAAGLLDETAPSSGFSDVPKRGALAVNSLKEAGVINGTSSTQFGWDQPIKRGDTAIMFAKAFKLTEGSADDVDFTDVPERYKEAVAKLLAYDVTNGISSTQFGTDNNIKRGDFAKFIYAVKDRITLPEPTPVGNELEVTFGKSSLVGNGADNTQVTLTVRDAKTGAVATDADDLVLEVGTSHGSLASERVTVQNGVATVSLTSEFTEEALKAVVTGKLIEAAADSKWHDEIGNLVASGSINFTAISSEVDEATVPSLLKAESNEADRLTLYFDKAVTPAMYLEMANGKFVVDADGNVVFKEEAQLSVFQADETHTIRGLKSVAGNSKALEVVLDVVESDLTPNALVTVASGFVDEFGNSLDYSLKTFTFTDARRPEVTSVEVNSMRELTLIFSEPVTTEYAENAVITVDGQEVTFEDGEFNQNGEDLRHEITVRTEDFLKAGAHSVQVSGVEDYAGNVISNDSLDFNVAANTTAPSATVEVESPEQVRLTWNAEVSGFAADEANFQYWLPSTDPDSDTDGEWVEFPEGIEFVPTTIDAGNEYVYELNTDWTRFVDEMYEENPDLDSTDFDYTNFDVRVTVDTDSVRSTENGLRNARQVLSLNYNGSPLNTFDETSPVISDNLVRYFDDAGREQGYIVSFDEPVKLPNANDAVTPESDTPSILQGDALPAVVVEFRGTDANGNKVVIDGEVRGYAPDHPAIDEEATSADDKFLVRATEANLQNLVDNQGYSSEWTLVVRNVTDDVGNAAATGIQKGFTIAPTPAPNEVFAAFTSEHEGVVFGDDTITIDYSSAVQFTGNKTNALNLANYTVNGKELPAGSSVALSRDTDESSDIDLLPRGGDLSIVTITLPAGTLDDSDNVINISKELASANGVVISGKTEVTSDETVLFISAE